MAHIINTLEKRIYELGYPFIRPMLAQKLDAA